MTHLKLFGNIVRAVDHSQAFMSSVAPLPRDWNRRSNRIRRTWLRTVEPDVSPLNIGLATAYHRAQNRQAWRDEQHPCLDKPHDVDDDKERKIAERVLFSEGLANLPT